VTTGFRRISAARCDGKPNYPNVQCLGRLFPILPPENAEIAILPIFVAILSLRLAASSATAALAETSGQIFALLEFHEITLRKNIDPPDPGQRCGISRFSPSGNPLDHHVQRNGKYRWQRLAHDHQHPCRFVH
jgi:hypothetical protein